MKRIILASCVLLAVLASSVTLWGLASTYPNGQAVTAQPEWPAGLADLVNSPARVGGYFVNACDYFTFAGDADALNAFLDKFAKLQGALLTVVLREGAAQNLPKWAADADKNKIVPADWQLSILRRGGSQDAPGADDKTKPPFTLIVDVSLGGQIEREQVKVPAGLALRYGARLKLTIRCAAADIKAGDEIPVEFTVTNEGKSDYDYMDRNYDRGGRMEEYRLEARDKAGALVSDPRAKYQGGIGGGLCGQGKLVPGASFTKTVALNRWALVTEAGRYVVTGTYRLEGFSLDRGTTVVSEPVTVDIAPRTPGELVDYIDAWSKRLAAAKESGERDDAVRKLMYTRDLRALPALIDSMYASDSGGFWQGEALEYYLPGTDEVARRIMEAAKTRGLGGSMFYLIRRKAPDISAEEMRPIIERSLAADNPHCWQGGALAAQSFPDARYGARLAAIAESGDSGARMIAMYALAGFRTDEGVAALRKLLADPDEKVRKMAADAVRFGYAHPDKSLARPLRDDDFPAEYHAKP